MNWIVARLASRPELGRLFLLALPILVAACKGAGGGSGY